MVVLRAVAAAGEEVVRVSPCIRMARNGISAALPLQRRRRLRGFFFLEKTLYTSRFVRVILAQGPC